MNPYNLILIRHGESQANVDEKLYLEIRDHNIELTDTGKTQALECGKVLGEILEKDGIKRVNVFVSPYKRTRQTWEEISKGLLWTKCFVSENPLLREQEYKIFKDYEDMLLKKERKKAFSIFFYRFKNAESQADVYLRAMTFLNHIRLMRVEKQSNTPVVIITHEVVIRMIMAILENKKVEDFGLHIKNCEIVKTKY